MRNRLSFLALGDSYTCGTSVPKTESWPVLLASALREREGIDFTQFDTIARSGWRTDNLANALDGASPGQQQLVSLLIGVNDQYQGFDLAGYTERFKVLLDRSISYAGANADRVFVVSIPDYTYTPSDGGNSTISAQIDAFNTAAQTVAERYGASFYNITPISRRSLDQPHYVAGDNLHPSGEQYKVWVEEVLLTGVSAQLGLLSR